jgi:hypothetical protein
MVLRAVAVGLASLLAVACAHRTPAIVAPTEIFVGGVNGEPAPVAEGESAERTGSWKARDEVEVEWHGSWWPAVVVDKRGAGRWLVHYEGYGDDWDEVVAAERVRERRAELRPEEQDEAADEPDPP